MNATLTQAYTALDLGKQIGAVLGSLKTKAPKIRDINKCIYEKKGGHIYEDEV